MIELLFACIGAILVGTAIGVLLATLVIFIYESINR